MTKRKIWNEVPFSADDLRKARSLRNTGSSWRRVAAVFGCSDEAVRSRLDPAYAAVRRARFDAPSVKTEPGRVSPDEAKRLLATIPADTRSRNAKLMGDPLPGRSALDQRELMNP
jgi:hypothetical protein